MKMDILICGVGGQGTVLASKLIASAYMEKGENVHSAETIGMAQRGGSVTSHVRVGEAYSPLIGLGCADLILAFEPAEAVRNLPYLKDGGIVITNDVPTKPASDSLADSGYEAAPMLAYLKEHCDCLVMDGAAVAKEFGSAKFCNIALLGAATASGRLGLSVSDMLSVIETGVKPQFVETNKQVYMTCVNQYKNEVLVNVKQLKKAEA